MRILRIYLVGGLVGFFLGGIVFLVTSGMFLFQNSLENARGEYLETLSAAEVALIPTSTPIPITRSPVEISRTQTPIPYPTPTRLVEQIERAEQFIIADPEKVPEILNPLMENINHPEDFALIYRYYGDAEVALNHFNLAAAYYEKLMEYDPSLDNLYLLANTYFQGGNTDCALFRFRALKRLARNDDYYREIAEQWTELIEASMNPGVDCSYRANLPAP